MEKPDVDLIDGLSPAISIEQKTTGSNPRSTVGTVTEIYDYLRLLFANIGVPHCYNCGREITSQSLERILDLVMLLPARRPHQRAGAGRARPQGRVQEGAAGAAAARLHQGAHRRPVPVARRGHQARSPPQPHDRGGRRSPDRQGRHRAAPVRVARGGPRRSPTTSSSSTRSRAAISCSRASSPASSCGISMPEMTPRAFSFNSPHGACPACQGLGATYDFEPRLVVPDETKSLLGGAIAPWTKGDRRLVGTRSRARQGLGARSRRAVRQAGEEAPRSSPVRDRRGEKGGQGVGRGGARCRGR